MAFTVCVWTQKANGQINLSTPSTSAAVSGLSDSAQQSSKQRRTVRCVRFLIVGDKHAKDIGQELLRSAEVIATAIRSIDLKADSQTQDTRVVIDTLGSDGPITPASILNYYRTLDSNRDDVLVFFGAVHGNMDSTGNHRLGFHGGRLERSMLRRAMEQKHPRLIVILTDSCHTSREFRGRPKWLRYDAWKEGPTWTSESTITARSPFSSSTLTKRESRARLFRDLFLHCSGVVDVNSAAPGELAGIADEGGTFPLILASIIKTDALGMIDAVGNVNGIIEWHELLMFIRFNSFLSIRESELAGKDVKFKQSLHAYCLPRRSELTPFTTAQQDDPANDFVYKVAPDFAAAAPEYHFQIGLRAFGRNDLTVAIDEFTKAIALEPSYLKAFSRRADAWIKKGNREAAQRDLTTVIRLSSDVPVPTLRSVFAVNAYLRRGQLHEENKQYDQAVSDYTDAIRLNPTDVTRTTLYSARSRVWTLKNEPIKALADQFSAKRTHTAFPLGVTGLGGTKLWSDHELLLTQLQIPDASSPVDQPANSLPHTVSSTLERHRRFMETMSRTPKQPVTTTGPQEDIKEILRELNELLREVKAMQPTAPTLNSLLKKSSFGIDVLDEAL